MKERRGKQDVELAKTTIPDEVTLITPVGGTQAGTSPSLQTGV